MRCNSCGNENPAGFRFCGSCGAPLPATGGTTRETRKVVTVVFCDLIGSTALGERTDPEALRGRMRGYYEQMRQILERHGGTVQKFIGDAVMAVFGAPLAHEDDALRAVRAAWEMRAAVPELGLQARIGVNTGEVVASEGDALVLGDAVNVAARLEQHADADEVLIGAQTQLLVRDAVRVEPVRVLAKGKAEPVVAFRLLEVKEGAAAIARRLDTPLVGRHFELAQLQHIFERSVREQRCHLFTLLGEAGVGKSRLTAEFRSRLDATVVEGRCLDYGEGITFWPVISTLRQLGQRAEETLQLVACGCMSASELFLAVRRQLESVARERPLVVVFDDVHWGEEMFLDLIDHIADLSRGVPLLLLCLARAELLDKRPAWGGGKLNATTILLEPLTAAECGELIEAQGGAEPGTQERIIAAAQGNPLFVEEMLALVRDGGDVGTPETVRALLQARLDLLGRDERSVIEGGAVEGEIFHRGPVAELTRLPDMAPADVESPLAGLVRKEMIRPAAAVLAGDQAFRFRHLLVRDAAYDALPKQRRAELHERLADWLGAHGQDLIELDELLGYHLEQAARYRRGLDHADLDIERRAGRHLAAAGSKAGQRGDIHGAVNLLGRALALLPARDPARPAAVLDCIGAFVERSELTDRLRLIGELEQAEDPALRMHGRVARLALRIETEPAQAFGEAEAIVDEALAVFAQADDDRGAAQALSLAGFTTWVRSQAVPTLHSIERMAEHAERAGSLLLVGRAVMQMTGTLIYGPFEPDQVRARLARLPFPDSPLTRMNVRYVEAELARREQCYPEALALLGQADVIARELGIDVALDDTMARRAEILQDQGRIDEAITLYRQVVARFTERGQAAFLSTALVRLADMLYDHGEAEEAARLAVQGEQTSAAEDVLNFALGRALRARIAADRGAFDEARSLAAEALEYAYQTDFPVVQGSAHEALGYVLLAAGQLAAARSELGRAAELWQRYGYRARASRARAMLADCPEC